MSGSGNPGQQAIRDYQAACDQDSANAPGRIIGSCSEVVIALTFDDGPHSAPRENYTLMINKILEQKKITAAFFVQAQVDYRMNNRGREVIRTLYQAGHSIQIHTGSKEDHELYTKRVAKDAYDINSDNRVDAQDGQNALQSDMKYAKREITMASGESQYTPRYARAPTGALGATQTKAKIFDTLRSEGMTHVYWDVDSKDNHAPRPDRDSVLKNLEEGVKTTLSGKDKSYLVILFHDINPITANNLSSYITQIEMAVRSQGRTPRFTTSREQIHEIFNKISIEKQ